VDILVKKAYPNAQLPKRRYDTDAGWDLFSYQTYTIKPGETIKLDCGVHVWIPENHVGIIFPRSSWRQKGLLCQAVFDHGYTGLAQPFTTNTSNKEVVVQAEERVLQLMFIPVALEGEVFEVDEFPETQRGESGAGSTGRF